MSYRSSAESLVSAFEYSDEDSIREDKTDEIISGNPFVKELKALTSDLSTLIPVENFLAFLDQKSHDQFDRGIYRLILKELGGEYLPAASISEFGEAMKKIEDRICFRISAMDDQYQKNLSHLEKLKEDLIARRRQEKKNLYGIMEGSELKITLLDLKTTSPKFEGNPALGTDSYFSAKFSCEQNSARWRSSFSKPYPITFKVRRGDRPLTVNFFCNHTNMPIGTLSVDLRALRDQKIHERWLPISNSDDPSDQIGEIKLSMIWIHSNVRFISEKVREWSEVVERERKALQNQRKKLNALFEPFPELFPVEKSRSSVAPAMAVVYRQRIDEADGISKFSTRICLQVYLALSLMTLFTRSDIANATFALGLNFNIVYMVWKPRLRFDHFGSISLAAFLLILFDSLWFIKHFYAVNADIEQEHQDTALLRFMSLGLVLANMSWKVITLVVIWFS